MKKSEYKANQEYLRSLPPLKQVIEMIDCPDKIYSKSGCTCCWHCPSCGRTGCSNVLGFGSPNIEYKIVKCELTD